MDSRQREALDRYITGNYGEDQFDADTDEQDGRPDHDHDHDPFDASCDQCRRYRYQLERVVEDAEAEGVLVTEATLRMDGEVVATWSRQANEALDEALAAGQSVTRLEDTLGRPVAGPPRVAMALPTAQLMEQAPATRRRYGVIVNAKEAADAWRLAQVDVQRALSSEPAAMHVVDCQAGPAVLYATVTAWMVVVDVYWP